MKTTALLARLILRWRSSRLAAQARRRRRALALHIRREQWEIALLERDARRLGKIAALRRPATAAPGPQSAPPAGLGALISGAPTHLGRVPRPTLHLAA